MTSIPGLVCRTIAACSFLLGLLSVMTYHVRAETADASNNDDDRNFFVRLLEFPQGLTKIDLLVLGVFLTVAFEVLDHFAKSWGIWWKSEQIPVRGKHLDYFSPRDVIYIGFSKANTAPFTYFYLSFAAARCPWKLTEVSLTNTLAALVGLFIVFDFVYTLLHWALHIPSIYGYIHKHHHHQKAPSRAAVDAINVHPIEYILGEYNHLLALWFCHSFIVPVHGVTSVVFLGIGGMLAALNHTRHDVVISFMGVTIYDSKVHDVHHRIPQSNYGQYTMFWDRVFGTFRDYNPKDRVNPEAQLDPKSGKSIEATKKEYAQRLIRPEEQWPTYKKETTTFHNGFKVVKLKE